MPKDSARDHKESGEVKQARYGVIVAVVFGGLGIAGVVAQALGLVTPGQRLEKVEGLIPVVADHEARIRAGEERDELIEAIADAVGAKKRRRRRNP